ncbi:ATP-binding region ATPase domain protein [Cellulomonas fimi ATCC 484]|uniref:ATP-binding region ATPase domain protein n=1 Tax=Cellulomonas fimi (strain ATCC 484 / DSM 20113 / JCM 1341 / CCUG 24087 / LMG 16345 / NBRC 15513 / NCIMB 8980 / NCTC 7547 / NRS-133) TaxID=590998 RepID=F4H896_CELFA|nr:ATP-binding region ATPase domain protein [Cellulomonas fimi ATCC 484]VEH26901.1 Signal transduction histidine kinase [Cellulomonas fimi]
MRRQQQLVVDDEVVVRAERSAPRAARHWVMRAVAGAGVTGATNQVVELLTGELVSNAVVHGPDDGLIHVHVSVGPRLVRVGVSDDGPGRPTVSHPEPTAPSGRGMALVEALAASWGTVARGDGQPGKTVWFELDHTD